MKELNSVERNEIALDVASKHFSRKPRLDLIKDGSYASLYRVHEENRVLKISAGHRIDLESLFYQVLTKHKVPVICSERLSKYALCLEDLATSENWRLATQDDVQKEEIGLACALWYQAFHSAGRAECNGNPALSKTLRWEYDLLSEEALHHAGQTYSLNGLRAWNQICEMSREVVNYLRPKVDTFTYNDFFYVNLAVALDKPLITVFDFDHSGKGLAESDYSNVSSGLYGEALTSFQASMPVDQGLLIMDELLSVLHGIVVASQRKQTPSWAMALLESVRTEKLTESLEEIKALLES